MDGKKKTLTGYYIGDEELSIPVGGSDSISNITFRLHSTLGQHVIAYTTLELTVSLNNDQFDLKSIFNNKPKDNKTLIHELQENFSTAKTTRSPLIVDLDGDGVETTTVENGAYFDHDNNGFAEKTGWVGKDDGLLAKDLNGNGQIDDGTELFGNNSVLSNGQILTKTKTSPLRRGFYYGGPRWTRTNDQTVMSGLL